MSVGSVEHSTDPSYKIGSSITCRHLLSALNWTDYHNIEKDMSLPELQNHHEDQNHPLTTQSELSAQIIELQMSMAHLEMTVERLDQIVTRQDQYIQTLQRQLQLIYKQVENQSAEEGIAPFDVIADRPPHY